MKAKSIKGTSLNEIADALSTIKAAAPLPEGPVFQPTLALVFMSIKQDINAVCDLLSKEGIDILGANSCGEFIDGYQDNGSIVILLLDLPRSSYSITFEEIAGRPLEEVAEKIAASGLNRFKNPAFILLSTGMSKNGVVFRGDQFIRSMKKILGATTTIYGGMAGDDYSFSGSYVFTNNQSTDVGAVALILDQEKVSLQGMAISGWHPIGTVKTATKVEDDWLCSIDHQPAAEMYLKYLGKQARTDEELKVLYEDIGLLYPFQVINDEDPVMRTPMAIEKEKQAIKLDFPIAEGTQFQFSVPPDFDIIENVLSEANELKHASENEAEALLIFSCAGRLNALGPLTESENQGLQQIWKTPMAGFFTYGEFGVDKNGQQGFYSTTCSWVALKEK